MLKQFFDADCASFRDFLRLFIEKRAHQEGEDAVKCLAKARRFVHGVDESLLELFTEVSEESRMKCLRHN